MIFVCSVVPGDSHFAAMLTSWYSMDRVNSLFSFHQYTALHSYNQTDTRQGNCLVRVLIYSYLLKTTFYPVFLSYFLIFCPVSASMTSINNNCCQITVDTIHCSKNKKELNKTWFKVVFTPAANIKSILFNKKSKLLPNSYAGVYQLVCNCAGRHHDETNERLPGNS